MRVLFADDDRFQQVNMEDHFSMFPNLELSIAEDGQEAYEMFLKARDEGNPYQIVITDGDMPRMNGVELTRRLRRGLANLPVWIIMRSGGEYEYDAIEAGVNRFYSKLRTSPTVMEIVQMCDRMAEQGWGEEPR